jgi:energy-coupling factor transport system ATP-binding protein
MQGGSDLRIEFKQISFEYRSSLMPTHRALQGVSLQIGPGEVVAIVGPSGSGKTTLLQHLNGLLVPTSGEILIDGQNLHSESRLLQQIRRRIGVAFQFPEIQLFEETVFEDVAFGPKNLGTVQSALEKDVRSALKLVRLDYDQFRNRSPFNLSGGEKRRVALAGILAMNPEVLALDEPTVGLDRASSDCVVQVIRTYRSSGKTVIFVSHNMDLVGALADRVLVLENGKITFEGSRPDLFSDDAILSRAALTRPHVMTWMQFLSKKGWPVRTDLYTIPDARNEMNRVKRSPKTNKEL